MRKTENAALSREYMTAFLRHRSIIALGCCVLTLAVAFYGVVAGIDRTFFKFGPHAFLSFIYFTSITNTLAALSAAFLIPFAADGIRKSGLPCPGGWRSFILFQRFPLRLSCFSPRRLSAGPLPMTRSEVPTCLCTFSARF